MLEVKRWLVFLFVIIPMIPLSILAFALGTVWAVTKDSFLTGASVLDVWGDGD